MPDVPSADQSVKSGSPPRCGLSRRTVRSITAWFDTSAVSYSPRPEGSGDRIEWARCLPFFAMHLGCLLVFAVGWSWIAVGLCISLYFVRMFAITGFYHRYFSHRTFRTSRPFQFGMALLGATAGQRGPMWWAAHHRHHHLHSDEPEDLHSPEQQGFLMSHMGWFMTQDGFRTDERLVRDWMKFPEIRFLDRFDWLLPAVLALGLFGLGFGLNLLWPASGVTGGQLFVWGFLVSTILVYHGTYTINSLAHTWGSRRFSTDDDSRNNFWLALITLGEGWHNNHHHYPAAASQGFYWWEVDITYYVLLALQRVGLIWDVNRVPRRVLERGRAAA